MSVAPTNPLDQFVWAPQPKAQAFVNEFVKDFLAKCSPAAVLARRMTTDTGTRFIDWIDFLETAKTSTVESRLADAGWVRTPVRGADDHYANPLGMFPSVVLNGATRNRIGIKVDSVADFLATWGIEDVDIVGEPLSTLRLAVVYRTDDAEMLVVERHGDRGFTPQPVDGKKALRRLHHLDTLRRRNRNDEDPRNVDALWKSLNAMIDDAIADLGVDLTCDLFFESERQYWQRRNRAARVQKERQDRLGLGWANHDHHTYRSSREAFPKLVALWEKLGLHCRERFYAGGEAGWGAQVMEQPVTGIITFNDVDMTPDELMGDFSHKGFAEKLANGKLGTVGLWCELHGEAIFAAGMHHLECQFDWHALKEQLESEASVKMMDPFTTYPYLRQAFTEGERWKVSDKRIQRLLDHKLITPVQAEQFRANGAIGSHLENLERNDGYKGFNQKGVSDIIARTDPRRLVGATGA
jgi:hypothetical protein